MRLEGFVFRSFYVTPTVKLKSNNDFHDYRITI